MNNSSIQFQHQINQAIASSEFWKERHMSRSISEIFINPDNGAVHGNGESTTFSDFIQQLQAKLGHLKFSEPSDDIKDIRLSLADMYSVLLFSLTHSIIYLKTEREIMDLASIANSLDELIRQYSTPVFTPLGDDQIVKGLIKSHKMIYVNYHRSMEGFDELKSEAECFESFRDAKRKLENVSPLFKDALIKGLVILKAQKDILKAIPKPYFGDICP